MRIEPAAHLSVGARGRDRIPPLRALTWFHAALGCTGALHAPLLRGRAIATMTGAAVGGTSGLESAP